MFLFKPYLHLDQTDEGNYNLHVVVALPPGFKLGKPVVKPNSETFTREITFPLVKQHSQIYYAPTEVVISISKSEKDASKETGILVKIGDNTDALLELQQKGKTQIVYLDQDVSTRSMGGRKDIDSWDIDS